MLEELLRLVADYDMGVLLHSKRVSDYSLLIAKDLNLSKEDCLILRSSALLHDIGKILIPKSILNKPTGLTDEEFKIMKEHPTYSSKLLFSEEYGDARKIVLNHHERFDGKGYPEGLCNNDIPLIARILNVADCYDAMTSQRTYNTPKNQEEAIEELLLNSGKQFDTEIVEVFVKTLKK